MVKHVEAYIKLEKKKKEENSYISWALGFVEVHETLIVYMRKFLEVSVQEKKTYIVLILTCAI